MKRISLVLLAGILASLVGGAAFAGAPAADSEAGIRRIDRREAGQHARIAQGRRSGDLTRGELTRLRAGQRRVHRMERRAQADGFVTGTERGRIERVQERESRAIYRLKHNDRRRV